MFTVSLLIALASPAQAGLSTPAGPLPAPATQQQRFLDGCHPFASKTPACRANRAGKQAARQGSGAASGAASSCHPDPTKTRHCDALARTAGSEQRRLAARELTDAAVKE